ncbi:hypothetical protein F7725_004311 [Dissostichus mawsoni]|uniref:Uncharacterized protein n=1 Tax=Dissostichus mawsoni TaxID=36200 RepID=A0A7J5XJS1_DISMA|nr:hypothetical protein F7725_004311 [Dissostichus mawsoni]
MYVYIFWHTIILAVINAWLLYKRDCRALKMPKQEILNRRQFQADLASSLILRGRPSSGNGSPAATVTSRSPLNAQKRPSSGDGSPPNGAPSKRSQPPLDVRKDLVAHFPGKTKRGRCRHCSKGYTNTQCTKCDVRLCFSDDRNYLGSRGAGPSLYETPLTKVRVSLAELMPLGEPMEGVRSSFVSLVPFSCGEQKVTKLSVCHGWLNLPLGGCHGCDGAGFGCGAEVGLHHLDEMTTLSAHPVRSHWGRPGRLTLRQHPSRWAPGRYGDVWSVCGGLPRRQQCQIRPALPRLPAGSTGYCPGPSALRMPQKI